MRMVSNRHVNNACAKKFKKIHVLHKVFDSTIPKPGNKENTQELKPIEVIEPEVVENTTTEEMVVAETKPKARRRKKTTAKPVENNEENTENDG